jgi:hypothetical protein
MIPIINMLSDTDSTPSSWHAGGKAALKGRTTTPLGRMHDRKRAVHQHAQYWAKGLVLLSSWVEGPVARRETLRSAGVTPELQRLGLQEKPLTGDAEDQETRRVGTRFARVGRRDRRMQAAGIKRCLHPSVTTAHQAGRKAGAQPACISCPPVLLYLPDRLALEHMPDAEVQPRALRTLSRTDRADQSSTGDSEDPQTRRVGPRCARVG